MSRGQRLPGPFGLLHPLRPGDELLPGRVVQRAMIWHQRLVFVIGGRKLIAEPLQPGAEYNARSAKYGLYAEGPWDAEAEQLVAALAERIGANEDHRESRSAAGDSASEDGPALFLVPGHLGEPLDLTLRALHVLAGAGLILVEANKLEATRALLDKHGIAAGPIAELDEHGSERMRACLARGSNVAIFGVNEGIPGFCDPGKGPVMAADVPIRTLGGPSVLGMALMRVPAEIGAFTFLGTVHNASEARLAVARWCADDLSAVLFSWGQSLPDLMERLQQCRRKPLRLHLLIALTQHRERVLSGSLTSLRHEVVESREPVVVVLEQDALDRPARWWRRLHNAAILQRTRAERILQRFIPRDLK